MKICIVLLTMFTIGMSGINAHALTSETRLPARTQPLQPTSRIQPGTQEKVLEAAAAAAWARHAAEAKQAVRTFLPQWVQSAKLNGVTINGPTATGGQLSGMNLHPLLYMHMINAGVPNRIAEGFMAPLTEAWKSWAASVRVPGLPWYPSFAAVPMPVAPPMPNQPTPFAALFQLTMSLTPSVLSMNIRTRLGNEATSPAAVAAINDFCNWFYAGFDLWRSSAIIREVMGTGPVPHFAPPVVPVGAVLNGTASGGRILPLPAWP